MLGGEGVLLLVDVVCLWQEVGEFSMKGVSPPSRNDEDNLRAENDDEVLSFSAGWNPYKAL